ncbi:hypothetical protein MBLNU459_g1671t1 [Dothideomycetes sp. NU459]
MDRIPISVDKPTTAIRVAQVVGITSAAFVSGAIGGISFMCGPALMDSPAPLAAKQWKKVFDSGKVIAPPLSVVSAAIFGGLAYRAPSGSHATWLYTAAALLVPSIVPYTIFFMAPTNNKLEQKASSLANASLSDTAAEAGVAKEETTHALLDKWISLNLGRSLFPLFGSVLAAYAAVDGYEVLGLASAVLKSGANRMGN